MRQQHGHGISARSGVVAVDALRADPRLARVLHVLDAIPPASTESEAFTRACVLVSTPLQLLTVLAVEIGRPRMLAWSAADVPGHHRASAEVRAWATSTAILSGHEVTAAPHIHELNVSLPPFEGMAPWFVQFEGRERFDPLAGEVLRRVANRLREICTAVTALDVSA